MSERLRDYGWSRHFEAGFEVLATTGLEPARVVESQRGQLRLVTAEATVRGRLSGRSRHRAAGGDRAVVGDWVAYEPADREGEAVVHAVLERRNRLSRKEAGARAVEQIAAANVDQVLLVMGLDDDYNLRRLERFLVMAEECGARAAVVLNKTDLCDEVEARLDAVRALCLGSPVVALSALGDSLDALEVLLTPRETVAFVGSSGAGKSTLINRLLGEERQSTRPVRDGDSRGRHATTHRELFRLPGGALVIDNPGVREIQLWSSDAALPRIFDDIEELARSCRFNDCGHTTEPGCAVQLAISEGRLDAGRLESLRRLESEAAALERRKDVRAQRDRDRKLTRFYRSVLDAKKHRRR